MNQLILFPEEIIKNQIELKITEKNDPRLVKLMKQHYSKPKGFVGRTICYAIYYNSVYYGHIVAGSATLFLPNRNEFFEIEKSNLNKIINNVFYSINRNDSGKYPVRNFTSKVVSFFCKQSLIDWEIKYGDKCIGFETLVEKPRSGDLYLKAGWTKVGETVGYTCKKTRGNGTDKWTEKRVWNTDKNSLKPKNVLCFKV
jgi:hypothetical protein